MISFLEGILVSVSLDSFSLDVGGVGWQLLHLEIPLKNCRS